MGILTVYRVEETKGSGPSASVRSRRQRWLPYKRLVYKASELSHSLAMIIHRYTLGTPVPISNHLPLTRLLGLLVRVLFSGRCALSSTLGTTHTLHPTRLGVDLPILCKGIDSRSNSLIPLLESLVSPLVYGRRYLGRINSLVGPPVQLPGKRPWGPTDSFALN
jgi:hypothetical protein